MFNHLLKRQRDFELRREQKAIDVAQHARNLLLESEMLIKVAIAPHQGTPDAALNPANPTHDWVLRGRAFLNRSENLRKQVPN